MLYKLKISSFEIYNRYNLFHRRYPRLVEDRSLDMDVGHLSYLFFLVLLILLDLIPLNESQRRARGRRTNRRRSRITRCRPTTADIYGPYYRPSFPKLHRLCSPDASRYRQHALIVSGYVYERNCRTPIPRARLEIWQADRRGKYEGAARCRGYVQTNNNGYYRFLTVHPGKYQVSYAEAQRVAQMYNRPMGHRWRPAHIHFKVNGRRGHKSLVSQMYFAGDAHLGRNDTCIVCNSEYSDLVVRPKRSCRRNGCVSYVNFNIVLERGNGLNLG